MKDLKKKRHWICDKKIFFLIMNPGKYFSVFIFIYAFLIHLPSGVENFNKKKCNRFQHSHDVSDQINYSLYFDVYLALSLLKFNYKRETEK